ncbi:hypothetical protein ZYGR_0N01340 [Zygosaccharomyces rouxii]|uniref:Maintenance of telomere capping protein 1 n=1 Tax=Zygosaccharomyces rouxii TaxID=4956 RepID=A0A1Q2ZZ72_ZYGRO|nr:hypothetical protein ZYGR_0N01340 [Zygosaccharomyces rouxii]
MADKSKEDDVFEFLESLPEAKGGADSKGDKKEKTEEKKSGGKQGNEDIMDFLDELEKSNLSVPKKEEAQEKKKEEISKMKPSKEEPSKEEPPKEEAPKQELPKQEPLKEEAPKQEPPKKEQPKEVPPKESKGFHREGTPVESREDTPLNDPITSFSNWWSSSGSATVSNFWSKTTEQASQIKTRLAQEQLDLTSRLNTNTITDLARNLQKIVVGETEEVLRIHLVHDLVNFSFLQTIVDQKFDEVFSSQVQGGIRVFSDQWGHPHRTEDEMNFHFTSQQPKLNIFTGKITDGEKLAFANLENSIKLFQKAHEEFMRQKEAHSTATNERQEQEQDGEDADDDEKDDQEDRISDIFISILPIAIPTKQEDENEIVTTDPHQPGNFSFTVVLKDITNDVSTITRSQSFPLKWVSWLEGDSEWKTKGKKEQEGKEQEGKQQQQQQQQQQEDDEDEDVDPSDWVRDWVEDGLNVAFGVVAQNYVIKRMGF